MRPHDVTGHVTGTMTGDASGNVTGAVARATGGDEVSGDWVGSDSLVTDAADRSTGVASRLGDALLSMVTRVPPSAKRPAIAPARVAASLARQASRRAAMAAGSLALPPGPIGWLTLMPEMMAIWKIQTQLVSDIAASYGRAGTLGREKMMYCLFRHMASQTVRDLAVVSGQRLLFQPASMALLQRIARHVGLKLSQQTVGRGIARWVPVAGAIGIGAWAWRDTARVARTTIDLFERELREDADAARERANAATGCDQSRAAE